MPTQSPADRKLKLVSLNRICKFKKGDKLMLVTGKKKGKSAVGPLKTILSKKGRLIIEGVNMVTKHARGDPNDPTKPKGRVLIEASVPVSNVRLVCPKCLQPTRVGWRILEARKENGKVNKVRICRKCQERIDD